MCIVTSCPNVLNREKISTKDDPKSERLFTSIDNEQHWEKAYCCNISAAFAKRLKKGTVSLAVSRELISLLSEFDPCQHFLSFFFFFFKVFFFPKKLESTLNVNFRGSKKMLFPTMTPAHYLFKIERNAEVGESKEVRNVLFKDMNLIK